MDEDDEICIFGTPLPRIKEDDISTKKPITVADQIAVDSNGRRRFHGAFTGGFSAGFWNTVGSLEGWTPQSFKSSRLEKASPLLQAPGDFMDDEDMGEFGIAPHRIQATEEFMVNNKNKEKRTTNTDASDVIENPYLNLFLVPPKERVSFNLLKKMGWKPKQGVSSFPFPNEKDEIITIEEPQENVKIYNCDMGPIQKYCQETEDIVDSDVFSQKKIELKNNTFGLGYFGLNHISVHKEHINLFSTFAAQDNKQKKIPIRGQAFGVGAFEEDDDDIYATENVALYDFSLENKRKTIEKPKVGKSNLKLIAGCAPAKINISTSKNIFIVFVSNDFRPRNWIERKTRFGPVIEVNKDKVLHSSQNLCPRTRCNLLIDDIELIKSDDNEPIIQIVANADLIKKEETDLTPNIPQPLYAPIPKEITNVFDIYSANRFVSENNITEIGDKMQNRSKIYEVNLKRIKTVWLPCKILCEKMNVAEPLGGFKVTAKASFSLFENLTHESKKRRNETVFQPSSKSSAAIQTTDNNYLEKANDFSNDVVNKIPEKPNLSQQSLPLLTQKMKKKSELELKIMQHIEKHPIEKKDIYRAIFSNSDDDDEEENSIQENVKPIIKTDLLPKSPTFNLLRNTSPSRGLFASLVSAKTHMDVPKLKDELAPTTTNTQQHADPLVYGPSLPVTPASKAPSTPDRNKYMQQELFSRDQWVDKKEIINNLRKEHHNKKSKKSKHKKKNKNR